MDFLNLEVDKSFNKINNLNKDSIIYKIFIRVNYNKAR